MVDAACCIISGEDNQMEQEFEFSDPNLSQYETVLDVSETDLKVTSSPKSNKSDKSKTIPTSEETKVDQNVISSIHVIEEKVCQLSSTFECINEKLKQIDKFDTIIKSNTFDLVSRTKLLEEKLYKKIKKNSKEDIVVKLKDIDQSYKSQRDKILTVESNLQGLTDSNRTSLHTLDERMSLLETRLKEVVSKPHTQWEDSTNSTNLNLIQENIELKRENHHMKLRLTEL
jgi:hypothetical protein